MKRLRTPVLASAALLLTTAAAASERDEDFRADQPAIAAFHPLRGVAAADHDRPGEGALVSLPCAGLERQRPFRADLHLCAEKYR